MENSRPDWFDRLNAMLFATVIVLGLVTVAVTLVLYFPGADTRTDILLPL